MIVSLLFVETDVLETEKYTWGMQIVPEEKRRKRTGRGIEYNNVGVNKYNNSE